MVTRQSLRSHLFALLSLTAGVVIHAAAQRAWIGQQPALFAMTILVLGFLSVKIMRTRAAGAQRWLLNPVVLTSLSTFVLGFGLSNVVYFLPADKQQLIGINPHVTASMVKHMGLVLLGAVMMWAGYESRAGKFLGARMLRVSRRRWIRTATSAHGVAIPCLTAIAVIARLLQLHLGVFGYASDYDRLLELDRYTQYLAMLASLGSLSLLLAALSFFRQSDRRRGKALLLLIVIIEIFFGLLSGFKSQVASPFVIVGCCYYLVYGRVPIRWIGASLAAIVLAYAVIEPYRHFQNSNYVDSGRSVTGITGSLLSAQEEQANRIDSSPPTWLLLMGRVSLLYTGALGVEFKDSKGELPAGSPAFLRNLVLAPFYAVIPRFVFPNKPIGDMGLWYTHVVVGRQIMSSTASGPFTYLYLAGGAPALVAFFLAFGVFLRLVVVLVRPDESIAASMMYLAIVMTVATLPSAVDGMIVDIVRIVPLILALQLVVFPGKRSFQHFNVVRTS